MIIEYQRIVEDIQTLLSADTDPTEAALKEVYQRYVDAVTQTNVRLEECDRLLDQGLRAEAIHKSEMEPNLLDVTGVLEFPERENWCDYVRQYGLPEPPEPKLDVAQDLNDAYAAEQPLAQLMRVHRLHALARSPLRPRIDVMHKIAQFDTANPVWQQDIRTYERARISQLPAEVDAAAKSDDVKALDSLKQELSSSNWLEKPPQQLLSQVVNAHQAINAKHARVKLRKIADELNEAYGNFEVDRARAARQQWDKLADVGIRDQNDQLLDQVGPALDWLDEQDQQEQAEAAYKTAIQDLERALDKGATRQDLDRLYHAAMKFDRGIPDLLAKRLRERATSLDAAEKRKTRLIIVGVAAAIILVTAGVALAIISQNKKAEHEKHITSLGKLIDAKKLVGAGEYLANLKENHDAVYKSSEIQELKSELESLQDQENKRKAEWDELMTTARRLGIDEFSWETTYDAANGLKRAREISTNDLERSKVDILDDEIIATRTRKQQEIDEAFTLAFAGFQNEFQTLDEFDDSEIVRLLDEANKLRQWPRADSNEKRKVEPYIAQLNEKRETLKRIGKETALVNSVTNAVGNRTRFAAKLQEYIDDSPSNDQRKTDFRQVLAYDTELWDGAERWNQLITDWSKRDLSGLEPQSAKVLLSQANTLLRDYPGFTGEDKLKEVIQYLDSVAQRSPSTQQLEALYTVLNSREFEDLKMLLTSGGKRYYFIDNPPKLTFPGSGKWRFNYFKDFSYTNLESVVIETSEIANEQKGNSFDWTSPQSKIATSILEQLRNLQATGNRNATFQSILGRLQDTKRQDPEVQRTEPILRFLLIKVVLSVAGQGDIYLQNALSQSVQLIDSSDVNFSAHWIDPDNTEGRQASQKALSTIRALPPIEIAFQTAARKYEALKNPVIGPLHQWVGWLQRDDNQRWTCARPTDDRLDQSGDLFVIFRTTNSGPAQVVPVGQIRSGRAVIDSDATSAALKEGRPVYVQQRISSNRAGG